MQPLSYPSEHLLPPLPPSHTQNIDDDDRTHEPEDPESALPDFFARECQDAALARQPALATADGLRRAVQGFLAEELAAEPAVRNAVRNTYFK